MVHAMWHGLGGVDLFLPAEYVITHDRIKTWQTELIGTLAQPQ